MNTIIRVSHRDAPYTVIDRRLLEDERLSWAARGILSYLLAKPDDWKVNVADLCRRGDLGRDSVYKKLGELEKCGYLRRDRHRDAHGRLSQSIYTVFEVPCSPCPENPNVVRPHPDLPDTVIPYLAKSTLLNNQSNKVSKDRLTTTDHAKVSRSKPDPDSGGSELGVSLVFPGGLSQKEKKLALTKLEGFSSVLAQQLLDELAGRMALGKIHTTPLSYLRGLTERASKGEFHPEFAPRIASARERRNRISLTVGLTLKNRASVPRPDQNNPLVKQVVELKERARHRTNRNTRDPKL